MREFLFIVTETLDVYECGRRKCFCWCCL